MKKAWQRALLSMTGAFCILVTGAGCREVEMPASKSTNQGEPTERSTAGFEDQSVPEDKEPAATPSDDVATDSGGTETAPATTDEESAGDETEPSDPSGVVMGRTPVSPACHIDAVDKTEAFISDAGVVQILGEPVETSVLFIFDKSGSMSSHWGAESRWNAAAGMLVNAVSTAHGILGERLSVAALLFPLEDVCEVLPLDSDRQIDFMPAEQFLTTWQEAAASNGPEGSTPLIEAFAVADEALSRECEAGRLDHLFKIVVITDGEPNCGLEDADEDAAARLAVLPSKWNAMGIRTFVFGLPGSDGAEERLNAIAAAGGTDEYFSPFKAVEVSDDADSGVDGGVDGGGDGDGGVVERTPDDVRDDIVIVII